MAKKTDSLGEGKLRCFSQTHFRLENRNSLKNQMLAKAKIGVNTGEDNKKGETRKRGEECPRKEGRKTYAPCPPLSAQKREKDKPLKKKREERCHNGYG